MGREQCRVFSGAIRLCAGVADEGIPTINGSWRATRRDEIQDEMPPESPVKTVRLVIPERWLAGEIQDEIRLVRHCECGVFIAGGVLQDTRRDCFP